MGRLSRTRPDHGIGLGIDDAVPAVAVRNSAIVASPARTATIPKYGNVVWRKNAISGIIIRDDKLDA
jgi:hypothetical protein